MLATCPDAKIQSFLKPFDFGKQAREGQEFISGFGAAIPKIRGEVEGQLGLPQLRETSFGLGEAISDISGQIRGVPGVVAGTTRQSLITDPQRQRLVAKQQQPLREDLARLAEAEARISPRLAATEQLAGQRVSENLLPFQLGFNLLEQNQARQFSGYTTANQLELNRLIANQDFGLRTQELAILLHHGIKIDLKGFQSQD